MNIDLWIVFLVTAAVVGLSLFAWAMHRFLLWAEERGWIYYRKKSEIGTFSSGVTGVMGEFDRIVRPSVEYRIEAEDRIIESTEQGGE